MAENHQNTSPARSLSSASAPYESSMPDSACRYNSKHQTVHVRMHQSAHTSMHQPAECASGRTLLRSAAAVLLVLLAAAALFAGAGAADAVSGDDEDYIDEYAAEYIAQYEKFIEKTVVENPAADTGSGDAGNGDAGDDNASGTQETAAGDGSSSETQEPESGDDAGNGDVGDTVPLFTSSSAPAPEAPLFAALGAGLSISPGTFTANQWNNIQSGDTLQAGTYYIVDGSGIISPKGTLSTSGGDVILDFSGYRGTFSGISSSSDNSGALIGELSISSGTTVTIKGLNLDSVSVTSSAEKIGGIIGHTNAGTLKFEGCHVTNCTMSALDRVGALVGGVDSPGALIVSDCSVNHCDVVAQDAAHGQSVGGFAGFAQTATFTGGCSVMNSTIGTSLGGGNVGGLIGFVVYLYLDSDSALVISVENCTICGKSDSLTDIGSAMGVGGVIGHVNSKIGSDLIKNCYVKNCIIVSLNDRYVGGIVGYTGDGNTKTFTSCRVENCSIRAAGYVGGFAGRLLDSGTTTINSGNYLGGTVIAGESTYRGAFVGRPKQDTAGTTDTNTMVGASGISYYDAAGNTITIPDSEFSTKISYTRVSGFGIDPVTNLGYYGSPSGYGSYKKCSVTYDKNGATGTAPTDSTVYYPGDIVTVLGKGALVPTPGYVFAGWLYSATGTLYQPGETFVITADTTLTAQFSAQPAPVLRNITVTPSSANIGANGGSMPAELSVDLVLTKLPVGYTELEYVQGTGTQWIDTGIAGNLNLKTEGKYNFQNIGELPIFGSEWNFNANFLMTIGNNVRWHSASSADTGVSINTDYVVKTENGEFSVNDVVKTVSKSGSVSTNNITVYHITTGSYTDRYGQFKTYYLKMWNGDTLVRDFVPAKRFDGKVGLYDLVDGKFYLSQGAADFTAGPEVTTARSIEDYGTVTYEWFARNATLGNVWTSIGTTNTNTTPVTVSTWVNTTFCVNATNSIGSCNLSNAPANFTVVNDWPVPVVTDVTATPETAPAGSGGGVQVVRLSAELEFTKLPAGYTELEYIKGTGSQYIDTGVPGTLTLKTEGKYNFQNVGDLAVFGSRWNYRSNFLMTIGHYVRWHGNTDGVYTQRYVYANSNYIIKTENGNLTLNDEVSSCTPCTEVYSETILLYAVRGGSGSGIDGRRGLFKTYYLKMWDGDTLVRDFVPAKQNSDGKVGLYDLVEAKFYPSQSGNFEAGDSLSSARTIEDYGTVTYEWYAHNESVSGWPLIATTTVNYTDVSVSTFKTTKFYVNATNLKGSCNTSESSQARFVPEYPVAPAVKNMTVEPNTAPYGSGSGTELVTLYVELENYTQVEYLESFSKAGVCAGQYIDTGILPNTSTVTNIVFQYLNRESGGVTSNAHVDVFGATVHTDYTGSYLFRYSDETSSGSGFAMGMGNNVFAGTFDTLKHTVTLDAARKQVIMDGGVSTATDSFTCRGNMYLFASSNQNYPGTSGIIAYGTSNARIYRCDVSFGDTMVRDFVPVVLSSGEAGMYDLINDKFYPNQGAGAFTNGSAVKVLTCGDDVKYSWYYRNETTIAADGGVWHFISTTNTPYYNNYAVSTYENTSFCVNVTNIKGCYNTSNNPRNFTVEGHDIIDCYDKLKNAIAGVTDSTPTTLEVWENKSRLDYAWDFPAHLEIDSSKNITIIPAAGQHVVFNNTNAVGTQDGGHFYINDGNLTLSGNGVGTLLLTAKNGGYSNNGGAVYLIESHSSSAFTLREGVNVSGNKAAKTTAYTGWGGGICAPNTGTVILSGGNITDNNASIGGGILIGSSARFIMTGGDISANSAENAGGLYITGSQMGNSISGGNIYDNAASDRGGGVFLSKSSGRGAYLTITAGSIVNNTAGGNGGGIYINTDALLTMTDGSVLKNSANNGSAVYVWGGTFNLNDGSITDNTAVLNGGGVVVNGGTFTMSGGDIVSNRVSDHIGNGGSVYVVNGGTFTLTGGNVTAGWTGGETSGGNGGNIYVTNGEGVCTFTMTGGNITAGHAGGNGGNVYVTGGTFTMTSGRIADGNAGNKGGGLAVRSNAKVSMTGGSITANNASKGGGVLIDGTKTVFTMTGGSISGNKATAGNGAGVYNDAGFIMNSTANVDAGNDVYLNTSKYITLGTGGLASGYKVANITIAPEDQTNGRVVVNGTAYNVEPAPAIANFTVTNLQPKVSEKVVGKNIVLEARIEIPDAETWNKYANKSDPDNVYGTYWQDPDFTMHITGTIDFAETGGVVIPLDVGKAKIEGNGNIITNYSIDGGSSMNISLIGTYYGSRIANLTISNFSVSGGNYVGGLVGFANSTSIIAFDNLCTEFGNITAGTTNAGGLVGVANSAIFENCSVADCRISAGIYNVGGLVAYANSASFSGCMVENCSVAATASGSGYVGGLIGRVPAASNPTFMNGCTVTNCIVSAGNSGVGGLVGRANSASKNGITGCTVTNCTVAGIEAESYNVGGLVGIAIEKSSFAGCNLTSSAVRGGNATYVAWVVGSDAGTPRGFDEYVTDGGGNYINKDNNATYPKIYIVPNSNTVPSGAIEISKLTGIGVKSTPYDAVSYVVEKKETNLNLHFANVTSPGPVDAVRSIGLNNNTFNTTAPLPLKANHIFKGYWNETDFTSATNVMFINQTNLIGPVAGISGYTNETGYWINETSVDMDLYGKWELLGDVNNDSVIRIDDSAALGIYILKGDGNTFLDYDARDRAQVNYGDAVYDGSAPDVSDLLEINQYIVGAIDEFTRTPHLAPSP